jgi:hypothetical protein
MAIREVEALNNEIQSLNQRKQVISTTHNITETQLKASKDEENNDNQELISVNTITIKHGVCCLSVAEQMIW